MKHVKKHIVFAVLAIAMTLMTLTVNAKAEQITWGTSFSGDIGEGHEVTYDFTLPTSGKVSFTYTFTNYGNNRFIIRDSVGEDLLHMQRNGEGTFNDSLDLLAGNYTLVIRQYMGLEPQLKYAVIPTFVPSNESVSESYANLNNDVATASVYLEGKEMKGQLAIKDSSDVYKINLTKHGFVNFTVVSQLKSINVYVINQMGDIKYEEKNISTGRHSYTYFWPKGTYYVSFYGTDTGNYSFTAKRNDIPVASLKKVTNVKSKSAKVTWKRKSQANGYQIQVAQNKKFTKGRKTKTVELATTSSYKVGKLKKGKKYYVRIRTYVEAMNGKKYYSDWSKAKTVKIKK